MAKSADAENGRATQHNPKQFAQSARRPSRSLSSRGAAGSVAAMGAAGSADAGGWRRLDTGVVLPVSGPHRYGAPPYGIGLLRLIGPGFTWLFGLRNRRAGAPGPEGSPVQWWTTFAAPPPGRSRARRADRRPAPGGERGRPADGDDRAAARSRRAGPPARARRTARGPLPRRRRG